MAKQRRARSRPLLRQSPKPTARISSRSGRLAENQKRAVRPAFQAAKPPEPVRRESYLEAVGRYEAGLQALQQHDYGRAGAILESVIADYPEERELHERVRLYLSVCQRHQAPQETGPQSNEERLYAATLAFNDGDHEGAKTHLDIIRQSDPDNDHALYMLAVIHALRGNSEQGAALLQRAIEVNPENRSLARQDPDLESLRRQDGIRALLETASPSRSARRPFRRSLR